jgi:hypothetical protein
MARDGRFNTLDERPDGVRTMQFPSDRALCARCEKRPRAHPMMGCLCERCEDAIEGMTQEELDEDYRQHTETSC